MLRYKWGQRVLSMNCMMVYLTLEFGHIHVLDLKSCSSVHNSLDHCLVLVKSCVCNNLTRIQVQVIVLVLDLVSISYVEDEWFMDLNCFPISFTPIALQVQFVCRSKTKLRNIIVQDRGKCIYQAFLRSSHLFIIPKILNRNLWFYIYIWERTILKFFYFSNKMADVQLDHNMAMEDMWLALHVLQ